MQTIEAGRRCGNTDAPNGRHDHDDYTPNKIDLLFAAKAYQKQVDSFVKELKFECDQEFLDEYKRSGNTQKRSTFFGKGAGTYSIPISEAKEATQEVSFEISDIDAFEEWLIANPNVAVKYAIHHANQLAEMHFAINGEVPDGIERVVLDIPGIPERVGTPRLAVKEKVIIDKFEGNLPEIGALLNERRLIVGE